MQRFSSSSHLRKCLGAVALFAVVLALLFASTTAEAANPKGDTRKQVTRVVQLTAANIDDYISTPQTKNVVILFCVSWSQACKGMMNTYHHLSLTMAHGRFRNVVTVAYVDGDKSKDIVARMGIKGFPTVAYYTPNEPQGVEFYGFREHALMESFIFQYT